MDLHYFQRMREREETATVSLPLISFNTNYITQSYEWNLLVLFIARYILKSEKKKKWDSWAYYFTFLSLFSHCQILVSFQHTQGYSSTSVTLFIKINYGSLKNLSFILLQHHNSRLFEKTGGTRAVHRWLLLSPNVTFQNYYEFRSPYSSPTPTLFSESNSRLRPFVTGPWFPIWFRHEIVELQRTAWQKLSSIAHLHYPRLED